VEASTEQMLRLYALMVRSRAFEEMAISQVKEGKIPSSWMSGIGQEGTIVGSVRKTGRLVVVDEDTERCGVGAEIGAQVMERAFSALKGPVLRVANPNLPIPYSSCLERAVLPSQEKIEAAILQTLQKDTG